MLDENLPTLFLKPSAGRIKHINEFHFSHHGSDPSPAYTLQHADPTSPSPNHKNCYAAALFDSYNPEVLYGEVLARPRWTQASISQEDARRNGGVPPPPQPMLPSEFAVQLYNPDQQVTVELREGKWGASDSYEFSMPISTFRAPSASNLDRGQSDPAILATTPRVYFAWKRESKLGKDLTCYMTGKSTDVSEKKKSKRDPDITVALWRSLREMTIYEPNLSRVEIEDYKGLEVVLLLSAVVIKDLYFGNKEHLRETFNISDPPSVAPPAGGRKLSAPDQRHSTLGMPVQSGPYGQGVPPPRTPNLPRRNSLPRLQTNGQPATNSHPGSRPPPLADPRAQWELDAETARLKAQTDAEAREAQRRRQAQEKADEAESRRLQKLIDAEEKEARRKQAAIDKETDRLRKLYGMQPIPGAASGSRPPPPQPPRNQGYGYPQGGPVMSGGAGSQSRLDVPGGPPGGGAKKKKSFFGLRSSSDDAAGTQNKLAKKSSAMW